MGYRITINVDDCMSSGKCVADHPEGFDFDDDELATLVDGGRALSDEAMLHAARNCPSRAIVVTDDAGETIAT